MIRVIVAVRHTSENRGRDLELPAAMPIGELAAILTETLKWPAPFPVRVESPARTLKPEESLASAGVWDGSSLVFGPVNPVPHQPPSHLRHAFLRSVSGRELQLTESDVILGRRKEGAAGTPPNLVDLSDEPGAGTVSRNHARIRLGDAWTVEMCPGAKNKTLLNGVSIQSMPSATEAGSQPLKNGDCLQLGAVRLWFYAQTEDHE